MRISRIITVSTTSYDAMLKLGLARSRLEIMKICLVRHKSTSVLYDNEQLPLSADGRHMGWSFEPRHGSPIHASSGVPGSVLWVTDVHSCNTVQVTVGSWLMGAVHSPDGSHISSLFTPTSSRLGTDAQVVTLIRPGLSHPTLVCTPYGPRFFITFIELQNCDELGVPNRRRCCNTRL